MMKALLLVLAVTSSCAGDNSSVVEQPAICLTSGDDGNGGGDGLSSVAWDSVQVANPQWTMSTSRESADVYCAGSSIFSCTFHLYLPYHNDGADCLCDCLVQIITDDQGNDQIVVECHLELPAAGECHIGACGNS